MDYFKAFPRKTDNRTLYKMQHYLDIYDRELAHLQNQEVGFLEIGIYQGGSMRMWQDFFSPTSRLTFVDIDQNCAKLELPGTQVVIGDQSDRAFLSKLGSSHGPFDIIVDDGGHQMNQQITSFCALWPYLRDNGIYIIEDTHSSYWPGFGGGYRNPASLIEFTKTLVDKMHSWYTDDDEGFPFDNLARQIYSINYYDSLIFIRTKSKLAPREMTATNGKVVLSDEILKIRNRVSVFPT